MNKGFMKTTLSLALLAAMPLAADTKAEIEELKAKIAELEEKTNVLVEETTNIKSGSFSYTEIDRTQTMPGMGDAASKVYYSKSPLSIGGYGEMYWANPDNGDAYTDVYRFIPYIGYKFSDNIILNTEIEFEHGNEVVVEFMFLDFLINEAFNIRVGHVLVPMGLVNRMHEPTLFNTVQRPELERQLIPSTWHETGVLAHGAIGESGWNYTAGFVNALNLQNSGSASWIRSGRGGSSKTTMNRVAAVANLDYTGINGLLVGASAYYGDAAQGEVTGSSAFIYEAHATFEASGFKVKGLYTATTVDGAEKWGDPAAATDASGYYVNAEYNLLNHMGMAQKLPLFVQYQNYNTTEEVVSGTAKNNETTRTTVGLNFFPDDQVVLKLDYEMIDYDNNADAGKEDTDILSFGIGFIF